jgi:glycosyltransferase involved in cell wall biosynthesis
LIKTNFSGTTRYELQGTVRLPGNVDNPLAYFSRAEVSVLSSHVEGMPNVPVEAMFCGCTPVATNCPTGPREVLQQGKYSYLVPVRDPDSLAYGILRALLNPVSAERLQAAILPFREDTVIARHFDLLGIDMARFTSNTTAESHARGD